MKKMNLLRLIAILMTLGCLFTANGQVRGTTIQVDGVYYFIMSDSTACVSNNRYYEGNRNVVIRGTISDGEREYTVTEVIDYAFENSSQMDTLILPNTIKKIGYEAFQNCGMKKAVIPNSVESLGDRAFHMCSNLVDLTIGNSITTIGYSCFADF